MSDQEEAFEEEWVLPEITDFKKEFEIIETVGKGNFGAVYSAKHIESGFVLAVKRVRVEVQSELAEIQREINIMQACDCPFVVKYYGHFINKASKGWSMHIFMELMELCSLRDLLNLKKSGFAEGEIAMICRYVLLGLLYLHFNKKIHRDIKADNILVNAAGEAKLADFGVSGQMESTMAKKNTLIGTPVFIAPEVIVNDGGYNTKVDIWSLGITAIELAETVPPYHNKNPMHVLMTIPQAPPPKLKEAKKWSPLFPSFLAACLTKNPESRPSADLLLNHPFIIDYADDCEEIMGNLVDTCMKLKEEHRNDPVEDDARLKKRREVEKQLRSELKPEDKKRKSRDNFEKWDEVADKAGVPKKERRRRRDRKDRGKKDKERRRRDRKDKKSVAVAATDGANESGTAAADGEQRAKSSAKQHEEEGGAVSPRSRERESSPRSAKENGGGNGELSPRSRDRDKDRGTRDRSREKDRERDRDRELRDSERAVRKAEERVKRRSSEMAAEREKRDRGKEEKVRQEQRTREIERARQLAEARALADNFSKDDYQDRERELGISDEGTSNSNFHRRTTSEEPDERRTRDKEREKDRTREKDRERERDKDRDRDRNRDREREKDRERDRDKDRNERERDRRDRSGDKDRERERNRDEKQAREKDRDRARDKEKRGGRRDRKKSRDD